METPKKIKCKLCNSPTFTYEWSDFTLLQCRKCLLVSDHKIYKYNELVDLYHNLYHNENGYDNYNIEYQQLLNNVQPKLGWSREKAISINKITSDTKALEFGSGVGVFGNYLINKNINYLGVELDEEIVSKTKNIFGDAIIQGDIQNFFSRQKYDIVFAFEIIEHVSNLENAILNISKILYPHGVFCFSVPNILRSKNNRNRISQDKPPVHLNFFSKISIIRILENYNFNNIVVYERPYPMLSSPWKHWVRFLSGRYHGMSLVVKASKN